MKGSMDFGLPALQRQLEIQDRLTSLVQMVEWSGAAARAFEAANQLKCYGEMYRTFENIKPIIPAIQRQWDVVDSIAQSALVAMKAYPVDYISQIQGVINHLYPAIENINISRGMINDAIKVSSMIPDMGMVQSAIKGIEYASLALKSLTAYPVSTIMESVIEKTMRWQSFGDIITIDDVDSMLDDIEDITFYSHDNKQSGIWDVSKNQFFVGAALALITLLWGIYTYFFPLTTAKEDALSKAQLELEEKKTAYLEMTAIAEERQAEALERIAEALEQKDEAEKSIELLEEQLDKYYSMMERIEESMLILNEFCQEAEEGDSEESLIDVQPDHTSAQPE